MSSYRSTEDIDKFFWSPTKICSIELNEQDLKKISSVLGWYIREEKKEGSNSITLDLKIKESDLYLTAKGKAQSVVDLEPFVPYGGIYNFVVGKMINDPDSVKFQGSLSMFDFIKLFEINMRHARQHLNEDQFNAVYKGLLAKSSEEEGFRSSGISHWLSHHLNLQSNIFNKYTDMYNVEVNILEKNNLLDRGLIDEQNKFLKTVYFDYYRLEVDSDYLREFMVASKKKGIPRSDVTLIRNNFEEYKIESRFDVAKAFKKIFSKKKDSDLELEF